MQSLAWSSRTAMYAVLGVYNVKIAMEARLPSNQSSCQIAQSRPSTHTGLVMGGRQRVHEQILHDGVAHEQQVDCIVEDTFACSAHSNTPAVQSLVLRKGERVRHDGHLALRCHVLVQEDGLHLHEVEGRRRVLAEQGLDDGLGAEHRSWKPSKKIDVTRPSRSPRLCPCSLSLTAPANLVAVKRWDTGVSVHKHEQDISCVVVITAAS